MLATIKHHYAKAIRTALIAQDNLTQKWYHIFSVIELHTEEMPFRKLPDQSWYNQKVVRSKTSTKQHSFSFSLIVHDLPSVDDGIASFNQIQQGQDFDGIPNYYFNNHFAREPEGDFPLVVDTGAENDGLSSVLPLYKSGAFVWAKIDADRVTENKFRGDEIINWPFLKPKNKGAYFPVSSQ